MHSSTTSIRVRYSDTDQMGYVYYGCYASYYEVGRVEHIRQLGCTYKKLEESGIIMPVLDSYSKFIKPAFYDEVLYITTIIRQMPRVRICFLYEIFRENKECIHEGKTTLAFIKKNTGRPCRIPKLLQSRLEPFFL